MAFGDVLDAADRLSPDEQAELVAILQRRLALAARQRIVRETNEARQEYEGDLHADDARGADARDPACSASLIGPCAAPPASRGLYDAALSPPSRRRLLTGPQLADAGADALDRVVDSRGVLRPGGFAELQRIGTQGVGLGFDF